jgi:hypothetical protein
MGAARRTPHLPVAVVSGLAAGMLVGLLVLRVGPGARADSAEDAPDATYEQVALAADAAPAAEAAVALADRDAGPGELPDAAPLDAGIEDVDADHGLRTVTLRFEVRPPDAQGVEITVDGRTVTGRSHAIEVEGASRRVRVAARARGFLTWSRQLTIGRDRWVRIELERFVPIEEGPGGLIDL